MTKAQSELKTESLYAASEKIYPREVKGRFQSWRNVCVILLLGIYYLGPWLLWDGRQAVLFDLPARKFHIFNLTFWPQDFFFLTLLLILSALSLFFFTAIAGRVWCGFACPQTVWTEAFLWMERLVEGSRAQQMKLTASPWNVTKLRKRVSKQVLWVSFSFFTGLTFVGYFEPMRELIVDLVSLEMAGWSLFWVLFYGFATYGNAGYMREQVCKYMCPYARFQSAMFDKETLIVAYNESRGEPRSRGKKRKDQAENPVGDCIDCGLCVQVCPTGIDIREGLQYECIACAACIDVCDEVMDRIDSPRGLIRYSTESNDLGASKSLSQTVLRPRVIVYAGLLMMVFVGFVTALLMRSGFQVDIIRDRNSLYRLTAANEIENSYQLKVMNKSGEAQRYTLSMNGLAGARIQWDKANGDAPSPLVQAGEIGDFTAIVSLPVAADYRRSHAIDLIISESLGEELESISEESRFWGPAK